MTQQDKLVMMPLQSSQVVSTSSASVRYLRESTCLNGCLRCVQELASKGNSYGNRYGQVVQRDQGLRLHYPRRRRCRSVRALLRDPGFGLQDAEGRSTCDV